MNLALHVTGRRADGYHLLDSLIAFPEFGDSVSAREAAGLSLALDGPFAEALEVEPDNLVLRAARLLHPARRGAALRLRKLLPVAAGIGGGSADAAATLRLLSRHWDVPLPAPEQVLRLGADVPASLASRPARMTGIGEGLAPLDLPPFWIVLANPGVPLATATVFGMLASPHNPPLPGTPRGFGTPEALVGYLKATRNDLETPARGLAPPIGEVLDALARQPGCALARMSGSGATCFGIFLTPAPAHAAAAALARAAPRWWIRASAVGP